MGLKGGDFEAGRGGVLGEEGCRTGTLGPEVHPFWGKRDWCYSIQNRCEVIGETPTPEGLE